MCGIERATRTCIFSAFLRSLMPDRAATDTEETAVAHSGNGTWLKSTSSERQDDNELAIETTC